jgi:hypothetical protein
MPAHKHVPDPQVRQAIEEWGYNVRAAAAELGMRENSLRKRCKALGIDIQAGRRAARGPKGATRPTPLTPTGPQRSQAIAPTPLSTIDPARHSGQKISSDLYPRGASASRLSPVNTAAVAGGGVSDEKTEQLPIKPSPKREEPLRLKPTDRRSLKLARFQLQAEYEEEFTENAILEALVKDCLPGWLERTLAASPKRRKGSSSDE